MGYIVHLSSRTVRLDKFLHLVVPEVRKIRITIVTPLLLDLSRLEATQVIVLWREMAFPYAMGAISRTGQGVHKKKAGGPKALGSDSRSTPFFVDIVHSALNSELGHRPGWAYTR